MSKATATKRKLAAIICMDLVGYSRHMKADEEGTLRRLKACRKELLDPEIADFGGRIVKTIGDGLLLEFSSIVDAVRCAVNIQRGMSERDEALSADDKMEFRIGINLCDVIIDEDDIYGDGVNITARIEKITDPGGICVSGAVYEDVVDKLDELWFEDMNQLSFKNIDRPVRVLRLRWQGQKPEADKKRAEAGQAPQLSVAVLPFVEPPQADARPHLAEGLVADVSRALARQPGLVVIAPESSMIYRRQRSDLQSIARELGVEHLVIGVLKGSDPHLLLEARLLEAASLTTSWSENFQIGDDVGVLGWKIATRALAVLRPGSGAVPEPAGWRRSAAPELWDLLQQGWAMTRSARPRDLLVAKRQAEEARSAEPFDSRPIQLLAYATYRVAYHSPQAVAQVEMARAHENALQALAIDSQDEISHWVLGQVLGFGLFDIDKGIEALSRAAEINPNFAAAHAALSTLLCFGGRPSEGLERNKVAVRLNPNDPGAFVRFALGYFVEQSYSLAVEWALKAIVVRRNWYLGHALLVASYFQLRRIDEARRAAQACQAACPGIAPTALARIPFRDVAVGQRVVEAWRAVGTG